VIPDKNRQKPAPDTPAVYQIRIRGKLDLRRTEWFDGMAITLGEDGDTLLTGIAEDQAALYGLIRRVRDLGIPLVSIQAVPPDAADKTVPGKNDEHDE
jgi:hypothetical protein